MKRIVCYCLILCMTILGLPACAPQEPTADVHAIQIGDTEKQVIEKAGKPDVKQGLGYDVFCYITNEYETEARLFWIRDKKVVMTATGTLMADTGIESFVDWEIDDSYIFESIKQPKEISVWEPGLDKYDIMGYFGPEFSFQRKGEMYSIMTYALGDEESIIIRFYAGLIQDAIHIQKDGTETVLWDLDDYTH